MQIFLNLVTAKEFALIFCSPSLVPVISSEIALSRKQKLRKTVRKNAFWQDIYPDSFGHEGICLKTKYHFLNHSFAIYQDDTFHALIANQPCNAVFANTTTALAYCASPGL